MAVNKILVPIDGSSCSIHALEYAARRRRESSTRVDIVVLNVQPPIPPSRFLTRALIAEHQTRNADESLTPALRAIKRLKLDATCHALIGEPAAMIVAFAQKKKCHEIVMGNSGLGAIAGLVMGSVARKVVFLAKTPVTLVK
jgi:nucleotide-binding universal stress UspA family protein